MTKSFLKIYVTIEQILSILRIPLMILVTLVAITPLYFIQPYYIDALVTKKDEPLGKYSEFPRTISLLTDLEAFSSCIRYRSWSCHKMPIKGHAGAVKKKNLTDLQAQNQTIQRLSAVMENYAWIKERCVGKSTRAPNV